MTTFARTWTISLNNSLATATYATLDAQAKEALFRRKVLYLAAGWTVVASSDSVTAAAASDKWVTSANLIWAAAGVAHSWIVLASPAGAIPSSGFQYILLDCGTGATSQHLLDITLSSTAGFTGFTSATTKPTLVTAGNGRQMNGASFKQFLHSTLVNSKYHTLRSNAGDVLFLISQDGSGRCHFAGGTFFLGNYETGSLFPVLAVEAFVESGIGAFAHAQLTSTTHAGIWNPVTGAAILTATCGTIGYKNGGSGSSVDVLGAILSSGGAVNGEFPRLPMIVFSSATPICMLGSVIDFAAAPSAAQSEEEPKTGTTTSIIIGDFWVPNGGVSISL